MARDAIHGHSTAAWAAIPTPPRRRARGAAPALPQTLTKASVGARTIVLVLLVLGTAKLVVVRILDHVHRRLVDLLVDASRFRAT